MIVHALLSLLSVLRLPDPVATGQTYAVVIGISDYKALTYSTGDLRFADRDAWQVVSFLKSRAGGNVPAANIRLLTNQQATQANIAQALRLFRQARRTDRVILYFSGHGLPDSFVPYDARPDSPARLLSYPMIKAAFHDSEAQTKLCIADACMSGGMTQPRTSRPTFVQPVHDGSNVAMLLASRSTQYALEDGRLAGGAFTYFILRGLTGQGDLDGNRIVTIRELHRYIAPRVRKMTRGQQTPLFYGRFSDDLPLAYL